MCAPSTSGLDRRLQLQRNYVIPRIAEPAHDMSASHEGDTDDEERGGGGQQDDDEEEDDDDYGEDDDSGLFILLPKNR